MPFRRLFGYCALALLLSVLPWDEAAAKCRMKNPDIAISGMTLLDSDAAIKLVGGSVKLAESEDDLPHARFVSTNGAQELILYAHYGAIDDEYAEVEVQIAGAEAIALPDLPVDSFKTGQGVELGMTPSQVQAIFGTCFKSRQKNGSDLFFEYEINDAERDPDLKGFGYPVYYAEYEFKAGKLVRFRFGFAYP